MDFFNCSANASMCSIWTSILSPRYWVFQPKLFFVIRDLSASNMLFHWANQTKLFKAAINYDKIVIIQPEATVLRLAKTMAWTIAVSIIRHSQNLAVSAGSCFVSSDFDPEEWVSLLPQNVGVKPPAARYINRQNKKDFLLIIFRMI